MVKTWVVKNHKHKATYLRREPTQDHGSANVLRLVKNGETVTGEFLYVRRASREVGFVKVRHLEPQCGTSLRVHNADGSATTLLRKQPHEGFGESNTVGYAAEGELVQGEFVFVTPKDEKRGGYVKLRHLRPREEVEDSAVALTAFDGATPAQRWAVLDAGHDGAWLRREPNPDRCERNIICLVQNGAVVAGDFIHVRRVSGEAGFVRFRDLEQLSPKAWRIRSSEEGAASTPLRRRPREDTAAAAVEAAEGERVEGEYVFVTTGKKAGYIKRLYLTALISRARRPAPEDQPRATMTLAAAAPPAPARAPRAVLVVS